MTIIRNANILPYFTDSKSEYVRVVKMYPVIEERTAPTQTHDWQTMFRLGFAF